MQAGEYQLHLRRGRWRGSLLSGLAIALLLVVAGCGDDGDGARQILADDIAVAHTPPGGYGDTLPPPILADCTEPLVEGAPDLRGTWQVVALERGGFPASDDDPAFLHFERIEQCGNRLIVVGGGVIHDMRCDGTIENGVDDVSAINGQPIHVVCTFEDGVHVLRPVGVPGVEIKRQLDGDELVWHFIGFVARLRST
jgi:hypothetical protein